MDYSDFSLDGVLASTYGIIVSSMPDYIRPMRRGKQVPIPGRNGSLTVWENDSDGNPLYETVDYAIGCSLKPGYRLDEALAFLDGGGWLVLGSMQDCMLDARLSGQVAAASVLGAPNGYKEFTAVFTCQPVRRDRLYTTQRTLAQYGSAPVTLPVRCAPWDYIGSVTLEGVSGSGAVMLVAIRGETENNAFRVSWSGGSAAYTARISMTDGQAYNQIGEQITGASGAYVTNAGRNYMRRAERVRAVVAPGDGAAWEAVKLSMIYTGI